MSTTVKKESTRKKSTKDAQAEAVENETAETKAPAKKTAAKAAPKAAAAKPAAKTAAKAAPKTAVSKTTKNAAAKKEPVEAEEPVKSTRGRKPKATAEEVPAEEETAKGFIKASLKASVKKTTSKTAKAAESEPEAESAEETVAAPKRKYTRKSKADETEVTGDETPADAAAAAKAPAKKTAGRGKKAAEEPAADENVDIESQVYNLIKNTPGGVYQNEIWKQMNIDSRKCSRILKKLLDTEQIIREEAVAGGTKTYLLKTVAEERKRNYDVLMVKDMFSPCTGCMGECRPEYCPALTFWIMNIHENPEELYTAMGYNSNAEPENDGIEMPPEFLEEMEDGEMGFEDIDEEDLVFE